MTATTEVPNGRYVYCVVQLGDADPDSFDAAGVEDEPVSVVVGDGVGAVVHECDALYDTDSPDEIRRWLLEHQRVVDEAGEAFGTPLPFRFDTVLKGGEEGVRDWLAAEAETLASALDSLAGRWEYRVEVLHDEDAAAAELADDDPELAEMREEVEDAGEGARFLLQKQYEQALNRKLRERQSLEAESLADRLRPHVGLLRDAGRRPTVGLDVDREEDGEPVARFAALASDQEADALGEELESVAADPGTTVRFTGPWPPYSFAPTLGDSEGEENASTAPGEGVG